MRRTFRNKLLLVATFFLVIFLVAIANLPKDDRETYVFSEILTRIATSSKENGEKAPKEEKKLFEYIEVVDSCGSYFESACLNVRTEPNQASQAVTKLRNGVVLKVKDVIEQNDETWYRITFEDEWLRYGERVGEDWYVSGAFVKSFLDEGVKEWQEDVDVPPSSKRIIVDRSEQKLYAYERKELFMEESISTGIDLSPTPRGIFHVYKKTPSRYMQGPIEGISEKYYDLPGVPWNLYFTEQGGVIHGAYWHDKFGKQWSSGCVNLPTEKAKQLYLWADVGTEVLVRD